MPLKAVVLTTLLFVTPAFAEPLTIESEPNDSQSNATPTVGVNNITVQGALTSLTDQDFFSFNVNRLGTPGPLYAPTVRILFDRISTRYFFELILPSGETYFSGNYPVEKSFDFDPALLGGVGTYFVRLGAIPSGSSSGDYQFRIFPNENPGGGGEPPTVVGTAVPEPSTLILLATGLLPSLNMMFRKKRRGLQG